ncbi:MAG: ATP-dependent protease subunit HslV [Gemmatimonadetes bacterium]|nr:ATP-dependent protease subunit HslV [Gemmatimonadota bacterium]
MKGRLRSTTVLGLRHKGKVVMGGDGQVTLGDVVLKQKTCKIRKLYSDSVLVGFAGGTSDALALLDQLESRLEEFNGNLERAASELARDWRTDRYLRRLEAMIIAMDARRSLLISGEGDLLAPDDDVLAIGSGAPFALAAARAYVDGSRLGAVEIVERSLEITADLCIFTNREISVLAL